MEPYSAPPSSRLCDSPFALTLSLPHLSSFFRRTPTPGPSLTHLPSQIVMSASNSLSSRLEELRSRNPQSPPSESIYSGYNTPNRYSASFMSPTHSQSSHDVRSSLPRRFTADSNNPSTPRPSGGQQLGSAVESADITASVGGNHLSLEIMLTWGHLDLLQSPGGEPQRPDLLPDNGC
jgi:hypothetical protein